jgi:glucokinase
VKGNINFLSMQSLAIGIDLGCTNIKGVLIDENGSILADAISETNEKDPNHWKAAVKAMITDLKKTASQKKVASIGLSAPGLADNGNTCISYMPGRLPGLENFNWSQWINEKVHVLNDAHAAMMAEATFGAAKGLQHAILISLGTGVGGSILVNGQLYQGVSQMAGHIGHMSVNCDSSDRDVTNMPGSIEDAIGNVTVSIRSNGKYHSTEDLVNDYRKGDAFASWVWLTSVRKLAVCIASSINILSPEAVILSGGITQADEALLKPLNDFLALYEWRPGGKQTMIRFAQFSDRAGAIGAAAFGFFKMK